jgi:alpha-N-arabinofuranosidase
MREAGTRMQGLSLHYYTVPGSDWRDKGSATDFSVKEWFTTLVKTLRMEELVTKHSTIMDRYDPDKKVGLIVDEWGTWFNVEPGTNPGFLYQQNTLRDALVAGINLNIFNNHCDRVKMANIAQVINVLQSVILTEGEKLLLTPTYHVFNMYKVHQDAELLPIELDGGEYRFENETIQQISASASIDKNGKIHISLCNLSHEDPADLDCLLRGISVASVSGTILTAQDMAACNTFENSDNIKPEAFSGASIKDGKLHVSMPPMSVVVLAID